MSNFQDGLVRSDTAVGTPDYISPEVSSNIISNLIIDLLNDVPPICWLMIGLKCCIQLFWLKLRNWMTLSDFLGMLMLINVYYLDDNRYWLFIISLLVKYFCGWLCTVLFSVVLCITCIFQIRYCNHKGAKDVMVRSAIGGQLVFFFMKCS